MRKRKSKWYSFISYLLAFTMMFSTLAPFVQAEENAPPAVNASPTEAPENGEAPISNNEGSSSSPSANVEQGDSIPASDAANETSEAGSPSFSNDNQNIVSANDPYPKEKEIPALRTETAKVYENSDGTYTAEVFAEPIHFKKNGQWIDIDNTLVENSQQEFENKANQFKVKFSKKPKQNRRARLFTYEIAGHQVAVELSDDDASATKVFRGIKDVAGTLQKDRIQYKQIYPGVTFDYTLDGTKVKENIILDSYQGNNRFTFHIKAQGLKAEKQASGIIEFTDAKTGEFLFYIQRPYMYDSSKEGNVSEQVTQEVTPVDDGFILTVTADEAYLKDPKRVYPVVIDPWIDVFQAQDTYIASGSSTGYHNTDKLLVGYDQTIGKTRSLLKWTLPVIPNGEVAGASVGLYQYTSNANVPIYLHRVTSSYNTTTVTWASQPSFSATAEDSQSSTSTGYVYFNVSNLVKSWYDGTQSNNGILVKYADSQEGTAKTKSFRATEWVNPDGSPFGKPKLVVSFRPKELLGITDYWTYTPDLFQGEGTAVVNVINGNMVYEINLLSLPGKTDAFHLNLVYNSRSNYSGSYGKGWMFSAQQSLYINPDKSIIEYRDDKGTRYHFAKQQHDTSDTYSAPEGTYLELTSDANGYYIKRPDETTLYFDQSGRNTKIVDEKGNAIIYEFDGSSNRVIKIKEQYKNEPPTREVSLSYNANGLLEKVVDFRGTQMVLTYETVNGTNRLTNIIYGYNRTEKKTIAFDYNANHQLIGITDANGNRGEIQYDSSNRVTKLIDPRSTTIYSELSYPSATETIFTDARGNKTYYKNNSDQNKATVNVTQITEDYQGTAPATTIYEWEKNRIVKVMEPNKNTGDPDPSVTHQAQYDEKGNLKEASSPNNLQVTNDYDDKANLIKEQFSNGSYGQYVYDEQSNLIFSTNNYVLTDYNTYDPFGNVLSTASPTRVTHNRLPNSSFEYVDTSGYPLNWRRYTAGQYARSSDHAAGKYSAKITLTGSESGGYYSQIIPVQADEGDKNYTIAGYVKTQSVTGTGAQFRIYPLDASQQNIKDSSGQSIVFLSSALTGTNDWTRLSDYVQLPANTAYVRVDLLFKGAGTVYFDAVQFLYGAILDDYYSNENAGFEWGTGAVADTWELNSLGANDGRTTERVRRGSYSLKINGAANTSRYVGQYVEVSGTKGTPITISGWAYTTGANASGGFFGLRLRFVKLDGTSTAVDIPFDSSERLSNQWQFVKKTVRADVDFTQMKVYAMYENQTGTVYFDNMKVEERAATASQTYTSDGSLVQTETDELGRTTSYNYDANGNQTASILPSGKKTNYQYDYLDRLKSVTLVASSDTDPNNITTSYEYDAQGNVKKRIDPRGYVTSFEYNAINQVNVETDPLGKFIRYDYDEAGNVKLIEKGKGATALSSIGLIYDRKNQLQEKWINGQKAYTYSYDRTGNVKAITLADGKTYSFSYDENSRLQTAQEPGGYTVENVYDNTAGSLTNGMRTSYKETVGGATYTTSFGYDILRRLTSLTASTGQKTEFYYNESEQPARIKWANTTVHQSYDDSGNLQTQQIIGNDLLKLVYGYDADDNIVSYFDGTHTHTYTYDFANRLKSWTYQGNTVQYDYDASGNLKNPHGKTLTFNAANEIEGFTYDDAGNLLKDDRYQYTWDGEGRLLSVKDVNGNTVASFTYRPDGLRETKTVNGVTYHYHYDG
ncbi:RHS repeat protein, partial [Anoxybacillus rupiensis]|uniref:DNRLRE domain-containing protein n=1 Tax=Anoxybacteroides rupiense TaxID=311460 RepID=UPI001BA76F55